MPTKATWATRATIGIATVTIRDAVRSRLLICLALVLLVVVVAVSLTIKGDGTEIGRVRVVLTYTLGVAAVMLGAAALWTGSGAISREIKGRQIQLIAVKPVHSSQIWLGKWLGLLAVNTILLGLVAVSVYGMLQWSVRPARVDADARRALSEQVLVGRLLLEPRPEDIDHRVQERLTRLDAAGSIPEQVTTEEAFNLIKKRLLSQRAAVPPGRSKTWIFDVPPSKASACPPAIRFRFTSSARSRKPIAGTWTVRPCPNAGAGNTLTPAMEGFRVSMSNRLDGVHLLTVAEGAVPRQGGPVAIEFINAGRNESTTALFDPYQAVEMLIPDSSFELNLLRTLVVVSCYLAFLSALGLTAGALFSPPVAAFFAASVLAIALVAHYSTLAPAPPHAQAHRHGPPPKPSATLLAAQRAIKHLSVVVEPAAEFNAIALLADGVLISWKQTGEAALRLLLIYSGCLGLLAAGLLSRRELALPAQGAG